MLPILKGMTKGSTHSSGRQNNYVMPVAALVVLFLVGQGFWLSRNTHLFSPFSIKRIDCDQCSKVGVVRDENDSRIMKMCPSCFGVGYKSVRQFDDLDIICAACGGLGRLDDHGVWRTCERCEGRGVHRNSEWKTIVGMVAVDTTELTIQPPSSNTQSIAEPAAGEYSIEDETNP